MSTEAICPTVGRPKFSLKPENQVARYFFRFVDLPNFAGGKQTLACNREAVLATPWRQYLARSSQLMPLQCIERNIVATYVRSCELTLGRLASLQCVREELQRAFAEAGWTPVPEILLNTQDIDSLLMDKMREAADAIELELKSGKKVKALFVLMTGDVDYLRTLNDLHERLGEAMQVHILSNEIKLSRAYSMFPWITVHSWGKTLGNLRPPASR